MKTHAKILILAATCFALLSSARAQLQTYQTLLYHPSGFANDSAGFASNVSSFNGGSRASQMEIFTNVVAIDSMTYNLFTTGSPVASTLQATFGQWNTGTNSFDGATLNLGTINVPTIGSWSTVNINGDSFSTFALSFNITAANGGLYTTNASLSYALMISQVTAGNLNYGIGRTDAETDFAYGTGAFVSTGGAVTTPGQDFTFSQIVVTPNPVPESSTIAAILGCLLVAALVVFRIRQQRQLALAPIPTAA